MKKKVVETVENPTDVPVCIDSVVSEPVISEDPVSIAPVE